MIEQQEYAPQDRDLLEAARKVGVTLSPTEARLLALEIQKTRPPLRARIGDDGLRAALEDMTGAYHQERRHHGRWTICQHPRCQNARLAIAGRGPFAGLAKEGSR